MSKQEKIVCAAIKVLIARDGYNGSRIVKGVDYMSILEDKIIFEITDHYCGSVLNYGFVTNKNRFVDPREALEISGLGNQLKFKDRKYLLPEDLY